MNKFIFSYMFVFLCDFKHLKYQMIDNNHIDIYIYNIWIEITNIIVQVKYKLNVKWFEWLFLFCVLFFIYIYLVNDLFWLLKLFWIDIYFGNDLCFYLFIFLKWIDGLSKKWNLNNWNWILIILIKDEYISIYKLFLFSFFVLFEKRWKWNYKLNLKIYILYKMIRVIIII